MAVSLMYTNKEKIFDIDEAYKIERDNVNIDTGLDFIINELIEQNKNFPVDFLRYPCSNIKDARYRADVMAEFYSNSKLYSECTQFCYVLSSFRNKNMEYRQEKHDIQKKYKFLFLMEKYAACINLLPDIIQNCKSEGLKNLYESFKKEKDSVFFKEMTEKLRILLNKFSNITNFNLAIDSGDKRIYIEEKNGESLSDKLKELIFDIFDTEVNFNFSVVSPVLPMSFLEERILNVFIKENPELFSELGSFYSTHRTVDCYKLTDLLLELIFYTEYVTLVKRLENCGFIFSKPEFSDKGTYIFECYNLSLAVRFLRNNKKYKDIVANDVMLQKGELFLLSGPNQGGKTTYIKAFGILAHLAKCGCLIPCKKGEIYFYSKIFTHFVQKEILGKGRLAEEITRIEEILPHLDDNSLILLNESFASTRRSDGIKISLHYLSKLKETGCTAGFVSHYYEIPSILIKDRNIKIKSLVARVSISGGENTRTFEIKECPPDGVAYARDIAEMCGVTFKQLEDLLDEVKI